MPRKGTRTRSERHHPASRRLMPRSTVPDGDSRQRLGLAARFALAPTIFGNTYRTVMKTVYSASLTGVTTVTNTWKLNSCHLIGPQTGYTGAFGSASPTGLYNLLSSQTAAGSTAPYNQYRIRRSCLRIFADQGNGATVAVILAAFPSTNISFSGTSISQFVEQPLCKRVAIPLDVDSTRPILTLENDVPTLVGVSQRAVTDVPNFWGVAGGDPNAIQYWQVLFASTDGSTNMSLYVNTEVYHEIEFFGRNSLLPTAV
jgi:hypothetical protein